MPSKKEDEQEISEPQDASPSYLVVMDQVEQTLYLPETNEEAYIRARDPGMHEDQIAAAQMPLTMKGGRLRAQKKNRGEIEDVVVTGNVAAASAFVAKCIYQITDYRLPVLKEGKVAWRRFNPSNDGDNHENRQLYVRMLAPPKPGEPPVADLIESFLDYVAGRGTPAQEDFEALLVEHPQLLATS